MKILLAFIQVILVFSCVQCSNILAIFNTISKSHTLLGAKLAEGLIKRGHHVTMLSPFITDPVENYTQIHLKSILKYKDEVEKEATSSPSKWTMAFKATNMFYQVNIHFWEDPTVQKIIKEKPKYDAIVLVNFFNDATMGLAHHLGIPLIGFSCVGSYSIINELVANPNVPYAPNLFVSQPTDSFFGRLFAVSMNIFFDALTYFVSDPLNDGLVKKYLPNAPPLSELKNKLSLILVNSHYSIEPPRPYVPNMIHIGGFHLQDTKDLPTDIKSYLDSAKDGAILLTFGSNVKIGSLEEEKRQVIFEALGELAPMKVLLKSELDHPDIPKNILVSKWLPQAEIMAHPNLRAFISHGGLGGNTEAVYNGVPILGIPFFGDQELNLGEAQKSGYAVVVKSKKIVKEFKAKLKELLENPKYTINAKKRSALMKEQPVKPMDHAAFWIEHVIKYGGGSHLRNAGMDLGWFQLHMIDIYIFYAILLCFSLIINYYILKFAIRLVRRLFSRTNLKLKTS